MIVTMRAAPIRQINWQGIGRMGEPRGRPSSNERHAITLLVSS